MSTLAYQTKKMDTQKLSTIFNIYTIYIIRQRKNNMDTLNNFTRTAQDIHNKHFEQKINKDQEIAERRINEYFEDKLNLSWKTILREINKLNELTRNKYFELLISKQINTIGFKYEKNLLTLEASYEKMMNKWKILTYLFLTGFLVQTLILILTA